MPNESQSRNKSKCKTHMSGWLTAWAHTHTLHWFAFDQFTKITTEKKQFFQLINDLNCKLDGSGCGCGCGILFYFFFFFVFNSHTYTHICHSFPFRFFDIYMYKQWVLVLYSSGSYGNLNEYGKKFIIVTAFFLFNSCMFSSIVDLHHTIRTLCNFCLLIHFIWLLLLLLLLQLLTTTFDHHWISLLMVMVMKFGLKLCDRSIDQMGWLLVATVVIKKTSSNTINRLSNIYLWLVPYSSYRYYIHANTHNENSIITFRKHHSQIVLHCSPRVWC